MILERLKTEELRLKMELFKVMKAIFLCMIIKRIRLSLIGLDAR